MKRTNALLDDKIVKDCLKTTGIKARRALFDLPANALSRLFKVCRYIQKIT